jgi:hypothetical protein
MKQIEPSDLTDEQLLEEAKKLKSSNITNALFIGSLIGIVIYSVVKNGFGFFILIPLFFVYKLVTGSNKNKPLEKELKARNLK